jgi:ATP-dependent RNA helicase DeaD
MLRVPYTRQRKAEQLLASAQIAAAWSGPPMAEEIRERDQKRLLDSPVLQEPASDEDLALGRKLLVGNAPEVVAAALVRLYRSQLPEPEDVFDAPPSGPPPRAERPPRPGRPPADEAAGAGVWFRIPIGRADKADPKWLIPLICRRGHVTKKDIGEIRIFPRETHFEIAPDAEARFREALRKAAPGDMPIEASAAPAARPAPPRRKPQDGRGPRHKARNSTGRSPRD